jgi:hypothetical protein
MSTSTEQRNMELMQTLDDAWNDQGRSAQSASRRRFSRFVESSSSFKVLLLLRENSRRNSASPFPTPRSRRCWFLSCRFR